MKRILNRTTINLLGVFILGITAFSCAKNGEPSEIGRLLTTEEIMNLPSDDSMNGELVSVEGYPGFCRMLNMLRLDSKNKAQITTEPDCQGENLIIANIKVKDGGSTSLSFGGTKSRNFVELSKEQLKLPQAEFTLDDYSVVKYGKLLFSGNLIWDNGTYYMDNVTIHKTE